jgi:hypothetical protein
MGAARVWAQVSVRYGLSIRVVLSLLLSARGAHAQSGWEARVIVVPNPHRAGGCSTVRVEPVDDHGYRRATLSNGEQIDLRRFTYELSNTSHFVVRNDPSAWGAICSDSSTPSVSTMVTVTMPDGVQGSAQLFVLAKGAPAVPAVAYRRQAPLRLPSSPDYAPGFVPGQTTRSSLSQPSTPAAPGKIVDPLHQKPDVAKTPSQTALTFTTPALAMMGTYHVPRAVSTTTTTLAMASTYHMPSPVFLTTVPLTMTGTYPAAAPPISSKRLSKPRTP